MALTQAVARPREAPRRLSVLGATGSIGCSTLDLVARSQGAFQVEALTAHRNVTQLAAAARASQAALAVIGDAGLYRELKSELAGSSTAVAAGASGLEEAALRPSDIVLAAIVGAAGLAPTMAAVRRGVTVALANKESLVCAGELLLDEVRRSGGTLLPVDSEHSAIFQVFDFQQPETVERIVLTCSGGPFRGLSHEAMRRVSPAQACAHPTWEMGAKISVDSATLMNKGLELIEAYHLFPLEERQIDVIIHPQSVIHSMVEYVDGSVLAQLGTPDMRTPIAYALAWPRRMATPATRLDLVKTAQLTFEAPDLARFPALALARDALRQGGAAPIVLNAANEIAVHAFLAGRIGFLEIAQVVERSLAKLPLAAPLALDDVYQIDAAARAAAEAAIERL